MLATSQPSFSSSRLLSVSNTSTTSMHSISKPKASVPPLISHGNRLMYSKVKVDHEPRKFYLYFHSKLGFQKKLTLYASKEIFIFFIKRKRKCRKFQTSTMYTLDPDSYTRILRISLGMMFYSMHTLMMIRGFTK